MAVSEPYRFSFRAMGSPCSVHFYAESAQKAQHVAHHVIAHIESMEQNYSRYREGNLLSLINEAARDGSAIKVNDEVLALLQYADVCYQQSGGLFDITAGVLREAWDFSNPEAVTLPSDDTLGELLTSVGWQHVEIDGDQLRFMRRNMALDFGGIVKEYAADIAAAQLMAKGVASGLVELGGDIRAIGPHPDGRPWTVKVRDPHKPGQHAAQLELTSEGLATSGDYERYVMIEGQRYSHLLSPRTGWPVQGLASVTVKAPQCVVAGSAATIAMLMEDAGESWLKSLGVEYLAIAPESV